MAFQWQTLETNFLITLSVMPLQLPVIREFLKLFWKYRALTTHKCSLEQNNSVHIVNPSGISKRKLEPNYAGNPTTRRKFLVIINLIVLKFMQLKLIIIECIYGHIFPIKYSLDTINFCLYWVTVHETIAVLIIVDINRSLVLYSCHLCSRW